MLNRVNRHVNAINPAALIITSMHRSQGTAAANRYDAGHRPDLVSLWHEYVHALILFNVNAHQRIL